MKIHRLESVDGNNQNRKYVKAEVTTNDGEYGGTNRTKTPDGKKKKKKMTCGTADVVTVLLHHHI